MPPPSYTGLLYELEFKKYIFCESDSEYNIIS